MYVIPGERKGPSVRIVKGLSKWRGLVVMCQEMRIEKGAVRVDAFNPTGGTLRREEM